MSRETPTLERIDPSWLNMNSLFKIWRGQTDLYKLSPFGVRFIWDEHVNRYKFASSFAFGKVLDISCGTGYGVKFLRNKSVQSVTGTDLAQVALDRAKSLNKRSSHFSLVQLDNDINLPFTDEVFDTIVSFETIEHLSNQSSFLNEIKRILRKGGKLIVSTPNKDVFSLKGNAPKNTFHTLEFDFGALWSCLSDTFDSVDFYSQGNLYPNEIKKQSSIAARARRAVGMLNGSQTRVQTMSGGVPRYFIAVCSKF